MTNVLSADFASRFWSKVDKRGPDDCWLWTRSKDRFGYGQFFAGQHAVQRNPRAHRVAYELSKGAIPSGLCVLHSCDNRPCCNPAHLWVGSNAENVADKTAKGRQTKGAQINTAKLNADAVRAIRRLKASGLSCAAVARVHGVSRETVSLISRYKIWKHIKDLPASGPVAAAGMSGNAPNNNGNETRRLTRQTTNQGRVQPS